MITEDYVSFETAKLLKEKGLDKACRAVYEEGVLRINTLCDYHNSELSSYVCAPTLQMAMKWLREVHNTYIVVKISHSMFHDIRWYFDIYTLENNDLKILKEQGEWCKVDLYNSYEEAVEAAIKYTLEILI